MSHNQPPSLWSFNKAGVFIEAMTLATNADHRNRSESVRSPSPNTSGARNRAAIVRLLIPRASVRLLTPRLATLTIGLAVISGIAMVDWMI